MKVPFVLMRGGTSRAVFFHDKDLPSDQPLRDRLVLRALGSPDRRQIDGLGGADMLTSKAAVIRPATHPGADVDYIFGQVGIATAEIDWSAICGNISAAVGPFAVDEGLVRVDGDRAVVRAYCPNHRKVIKFDFPLADGRAREEGDLHIEGVPGTGAPIACDYSDAAGGITGKVLPTGRARDELDVPGLGRIPISLVDHANPFAFVFAKDIGLRGDEWPTEIDANRELVARIDAVRLAAAESIGMAEKFGWNRLENPIMPALIMVQEPRQYKNFATHEMIQSDAMDLFGILFGAGLTHKAFAGTTTICTGVAARIPGTIVHEALSERGKQDKVIRIGHPCGFIPVGSTVEMVDGQPVVHEVKMWRTARRIAEGIVHIPDSVLKR